MATNVKESEQEIAFRKEMEACESVLGYAVTATLPEGTDYHVWLQCRSSICICSPLLLLQSPAGLLQRTASDKEVFLQYYKTFGNFREITEELQERLKKVMLRFPVSCGA
jgi:hypothetical protein